MQAYERLLEAVREEIKLQLELSSLLEGEREAVVKVRREEVEDIQKQKEAILIRAKSLEAKRRDLVGEIASGCKLKSPVTLLRIVESCKDKTLAAKLGEARLGLKEIAEKVVSQNTHNTRLLKDSLGLIASTLAIFRSAPGEDLPTYGSTGKVKGEESKSTPPKRRTVIDKV